tara:strand:- start:3653 stop:3808 length:156 start_codon:yes stop_codon:yes gene_type:complete
MSYFVYLENGCAVDAPSEAEAKKRATDWFISQLLSGNIEFQVDEEETEEKQ